MRLVQSTLIISGIILSAGSMANADVDKFKKQQAACSVKQVTHKCSVTVDNQQKDGRCVDAKRYGMICMTR
jgi:hypothetical protein